MHGIRVSHAWDAGVPRVEHDETTASGSNKQASHKDNTFSAGKQGNSAFPA